MKNLFSTRITELFGIEHPLLGGTMMHLSRAPLVAGISEGGGLGILASAIFQDMGELREEIEEIRNRTEKPFCVNLNFFPMLAPVPAEKVLEVCLEAGVTLFESSGHSAPATVAERIHEAGGVLIHKCAGVRYAKKAESLGVDAVTVVGWENGGAMGELDVSTLALIPRVVDEVNLPIVGGGGVGDGRGITALLALGAQGVIVGTRFLLAEECPIHDGIKERLIQTSELDTLPVMRSLRATHRCLNNEAARKVKEIEDDNGELQDLLPFISGESAKKMFKNGDTDLAIICVGQGIGQMKEVLPAAEIVRTMMAEADAARERI
jgi:NADH:quinone reductase (non-electrogenic)